MGDSRVGKADRPSVDVEAIADLRGQLDDGDVVDGVVAPCGVLPVERVDDLGDLVGHEQLPPSAVEHVLRVVIADGRVLEDPT